MKRLIVVISVAIIPLTTATDVALGGDEKSLYNARGKAVAYIAEDLTIYLWSGRPTAYLHSSSDGDFHVYGFNGKHLGWLVRGVMYDVSGRAFCVFKESFRGYTQFEEFKSFKQFKPFKLSKQFAPLRPFFSNSWSDVLCDIHLKSGRL